MTAQSITQFAVHIGLFVLGISFLLTAWRVIKGPTLPDRVIALDMLVGIVMGFIALIAIRTGFTLYIDIAISLGLVGFLATVAFARFILSRKRRGGEDGAPPEPLPEEPAAKPAHKGNAVGAAAPAGAPKEVAPKPVLSKSEATKASAAKVKIAKAKSAKAKSIKAEGAKAQGARTKAAKKSAPAEAPREAPIEALGEVTAAVPAAKPVKPKAPRKPAVPKETP
ncbi:cation:proton antiporter [Pseudorhizobium endolithicum]|uniref:Cation:proton antiporter n=1 Tax=Pseudorhizobium endolithicum TaxID=1191678 RepID=A0ABN7JH15_9HYPH|nr:cation:proton antiporter [Pseudorhizobium endolithicum]